MHENCCASDFKAAPFWWEVAEPKSEDAAAWSKTIDVAVIGGGFTGLSCALELARRGAGVVVLEAERIGFAASSRNGGMVSGGLKLAQGNMAARLGAERRTAC